jgi:hypothetical protein
MVIEQYAIEYENNPQNDMYDRGEVHLRRHAMNGRGGHRVIFCGSFAVKCECGWHAVPAQDQLEAQGITPEMVARVLAAPFSADMADAEADEEYNRSHP